jgi:ribosome-interacting GTPase 1
VDLSADIAEQVRCCLDFLESRNLLVDESAAGGPTYDINGNLLGKRVFYLGTKADIAKPDAVDEIKKLSPRKFNIYTVSAKTADSLDRLPAILFKEAGIIRVYTKPPGKKTDMSAPFTLPVGSTVLDLANAIHKDLAEKFKSARIWGTGVYDGQNAPRDHVLCDKDIVELHFG